MTALHYLLHANWLNNTFFVTPNLGRRVSNSSNLSFLRLNQFNCNSYIHVWCSEIRRSYKKVPPPLPHDFNRRKERTFPHWAAVRPDSSTVPPQDGDIRSCGKSCYIVFFHYVFSCFVRATLTALLNLYTVVKRGNKCTWAASVMLPFRILLKPKVRRFFRGSLEGHQRAGSSQFRWWDEQPRELQSRLMRQSTALRPPDSAVKVQPVTLTGDRRDGPTHRLPPRGRDFLPETWGECHTLCE